MKKIVILIFLLASSTVMAQRPGNRIKQLKTAYLTQELQLTTQEAREFWPIYDEYYKAMEEYRRRQMIDLLLGGEADPQGLSPAQAREITKTFKDSEIAIYRARMKLLDDLSGVLSEIKIAQLIIAEKNFNKRMLERFRRRN